MSVPRLESVSIKGYRPFNDFVAKVGALEVLVGANGSGKSSLFEFLRFLRDGVKQPIPPEIVPGGIGQQVFHRPGPDRIEWSIDHKDSGTNWVMYSGELWGPIGNISIGEETVKVKEDDKENIYKLALDGSADQYNASRHRDIRLLQVEQALGSDIPRLIVYNWLRSYIGNWRFYSSYDVNREKIRKSVVIEQEPILYEDCGNLSSVLHFLITEHPNVFNELLHHLRQVVPGFQDLSVKARGGPGEVLALWKEQGVDTELSLADLSDGILRLLCWLTLCLHPSPPPLICVDEPDQGVHPRTLPILAGLFQKASARTQIFLATHSSYFITQFKLSQIAVMKKVDGDIVFSKPENSKVIQSMLEDFGTDEIGYLHWSDQLEAFS